MDNFYISSKYQNIHPELATVLDALYNERNMTLLSSDKIKRADLIHEAFKYLRKEEKEAVTYYIDIFDTQNSDELTKLFAETIAGKENLSLKGTFQYLSTIEKRIYIAIDNFQQILRYPEKGVDALLRSYIQVQTYATFIFAGNNEHRMHEMFLSPSKPFFQSTQMFTLL